jgi:hypothetical protein
MKTQLEIGDKIQRLAGNSIVVPVLEEIFKNMFKTNQ